MAKKKIKSILENKITKNKHIIETIAIITDNKIKFKDNDTLVNITLKDNIIMTRNDNIKEIKFNFILNEKSECIYNIYNKSLELNLFTNKLIKKDNYIEIDYKVEDEELNFKLFIE